MGVRLHRPDRAAQHLGGLGRGEVLVVAQNHYRALSGGECTDQRPQHRTVHDEVVVAGWVSWLRQHVSGPLQVPTGTSPRRGERVHHRSANVRFGLLHPAHLGPARIGLLHSSLEQILGGVGIRGQQVCESVQPPPARGHELDEAFVHVHVATTRRTDTPSKRPGLAKGWVNGEGWYPSAARLGVSTSGSNEEARMSTYPVLMHTALDTTDVRRLAEFYRELLGLRYR